MLPVNLIKSLLNQACEPHESVLRASTEPEQTAQLEKLKVVAGSDARVATWDQETFLSVPVYVGSDPTSFDNSETLYVSFKGDQPFIAAGWRRGIDDMVPLASAAQLTRTIQLVRERLEVSRRRSLKQQKLKDLKLRAIETRVETLAKEHGLTYAVESMHLKVKLHLKLDDTTSVCFDIPHKGFEDALAQIASYYAEVRSLYQRGARYTIAPSRYLLKSRWRSPT